MLLCVYALMENRKGLVVDTCLTPANGHAERVAPPHIIKPSCAIRLRAIALSARIRPMTPRISSTNQCSVKVTPQADRSVSAGIKMVAEKEQTKFRECDRVGLAFRLAAAACNSDAAIVLASSVGMNAPVNCQLFQPLADRRRSTSAISATCAGG